ncbi:MAG TPA: phage tail protein [Dehalococcoidia bacterium]|jgi:phage tail-like protein
MVKDPLSSYTFALEIDGITAAFFKEGSGFDSTVEVIEHRESGKGGKEIIRKLPGRAKWSDITLKRGTTDSLDLWNWHKQVLDGDVSGARKNGSIVVYDTAQKEVARFNFINGWCSKWKAGDLNSTNNQVHLEEATITIEGLVRTK